MITNKMRGTGCIFFCQLVDGTCFVCIRGQDLGMVVILGHFQSVSFLHWSHLYIIYIRALLCKVIEFVISS